MNCIGGWRGAAGEVPGLRRDVMWGGFRGLRMRMRVQGCVGEVRSEGQGVQRRDRPTTKMAEGLCSILSTLHGNDRTGRKWKQSHHKIGGEISSNGGYWKRGLL